MHQAELSRCMQGLLLRATTNKWWPLYSSTVSVCDGLGWDVIEAPSSKTVEQESCSSAHKQRIREQATQFG